MTFPLLDCKNSEGKDGTLYTINLPPGYGIVNEQIASIVLSICTLLQSADSIVMPDNNCGSHYLLFF